MYLDSDTNQDLKWELQINAAIWKANSIMVLFCRTLKNLDINIVKN